MYEPMLIQAFFFGTTQGTRELNLSNLFILKKLNATLTELFCVILQGSLSLLH